MHVTILALGSYGDVWPYAVLGGALRRAGHGVRLATFAGFAGMAEAQGLALHPVEGDAAALMQTSGGLALAEAGRNIPRMMRSIRRTFARLAHAYSRAFADPVLRETDLILNQLPGGLYGLDLAEATGLPLVHGSVIPLTRTRAFPMVAFPRWPSFLPGYNWLTYLLAEQIVWQMFRREVNRWRQQALGLPAQRLLGRMDLQRVPVLNAFSRHVVPPPADWPDTVHTTGYWFSEEDQAWQPPEPLVRFLSAGSAPVFIGFGSMPVRDRAQTLTLLLEAVRHSGQRAILHAGWAGLDAASLPQEVYPIAYAPYGWLFPRVAAVVHHGGAGTTGAGLRAGVPGLVVPFLFDQFFWGQRLHALGVGPRPLPFKKLAAPALAEAIDRMVTGRDLQRRAVVLGEKVRAEQGLRRAVTLLEEVAVG